MFNQNAFGSTKQQTIYRMNSLFSNVEQEKYSKSFLSTDGTKAIVIGLQPDGQQFGMGMYELDGDLYKLVSSTVDGVVAPPANPFKGDDYIKIDNEKGKIVLQDTVRIEALKSCYPVGSIYMNENDSRSPAILMNWNDSTWEKIENAQTVSKTDTDPTYQTVFMWKRLS